MITDLFTQISVILVITVVIASIMRLLKQPLIIGYILTGVIVGPFFLGIVSTDQTFTTFSHLGIAFLLFMVGLNLNPKVIKEVGMISLVTGIGQVLFTTTIGFFIARALGFDPIASMYVGIALAFSSTIVIMKLISDKKDLEALYGRIAIGFLIIQDFIAIGILLMVSSMNTGGAMTSLAVESLLTGLMMMGILFMLSIFVIPSIVRLAAKSQEFLLMFSIAWCFGIAALSNLLNFSMEAGALLAGISLSMSPYHYEISSKMRPLRDFFLVIFFILLGAQMVFSNIIANIWVIILFSLFVLIGNPLIVLILMGRLGYSKRTGFLAGLTVAQISEFSFIVIALGISVGHISGDILSIITAVGLITFTGSTYLILYSTKWYQWLSPYLKIFEVSGTKKDEHKYHKSKNYDIVLFGYKRVGFTLLKSLKKIKKKFIILDYDPEIIKHLSKEGYDCRYGDANDAELLDELNIKKMKMFISTIHIPETNLLLIHKVRSLNKKAIIAVVAHQMDDAFKLYEAGATYVLMPHYLSGKHFSTMLEDNKLNITKFLKQKIVHLEHLEHTKEMGHDPGLM